jgi:hypothetical protein
MTIRAQKRRVSEIEGSLGFLAQQVRNVHKDLLAFQTKTEQRFDRVDGRFDKVEGRLARVEKEIRSLRDDMPGIVGAAIGEVERERRKSRKKT